MLNHTLFVIAAGVLSLSAHASTLPKDVSRFIEQREKCDHFRGEEPYDSERRAFLVERMHEYCSGTDAGLDRLKKKYATRSDVMERLNHYESHIELQHGEK